MKKQIIYKVVKSEKLLDEKLEEEHIEDEGNDTKRNEEADNSASASLRICDVASLNIPKH